MRIRQQFASLAVAISVFALASPTAAATALPLVLVAKPLGTAAVIQWSGSGSQFVGTYDSFSEVFNNTQPQGIPDHCSVSAIVNGSSVTARFGDCTEATTDGTYVGHFRGSHLTLEYPTSGGLLAAIVFVPGSVASYNEAVMGVRLLLQQTNALQTYFHDAEPSAIFFQPTGGPFFKVGANWYDVVTQQTNDAGNHAQANARLFVLKWAYGSWYSLTSFPLSSDTGPIPGSPYKIALRNGVVAYADKSTWTTYSNWTVVALLSGKWREVPFGTDTKLVTNLITRSMSMSFGKGKAIESISGCVGTRCPSTPATIVYTLSDKSSRGPAFAVTGLSGPSIYFRQ